MMKSKTTALILSILTGGLGIDRFYLGYTGMGILKLLTAGCFGVLYLIDIINIATGKLLPADGSAYDDDTRAVPQQQAAPAQSAADELKKYKELLDADIITQEEFNNKKNQLLGM